MRPFSTLKISFCALALLTTGVGQAQTQEQPQSDTTAKTYQLKEVTVTGTRSATDKNKVPAKIEVISKKDIELTSGQDFTDFLKKNTSVDIIQYPSLLSGVGIRGFRPQTGSLNQRSLLLVDGRPAGTTNLATLDMNSVERIEVLKGAASALYGSQAMGGVINVITKKSGGKIRTSLLGEYGSYQTSRLGGNVGGNITEALDFDLSLQYYDRAKDFKLGKDNWFRNGMGNDQYKKYMLDGTIHGVGDRREDGSRREHSKLHYATGSLRLGYKVSERWSVQVRGERFVANDVQAPSDVAYGNTQPNSKDTDRQNGELAINGDLQNHKLAFKAYIAGEESDNYEIQVQGKPIEPYKSYQSANAWYGFQVRDAIQLNQHSLTVGLDYNEAENTSHRYNNKNAEIATYSPNYHLASTAAYAQAQLSFLGDKLFINPGLRFDLISYIVKQTPLLDTYSAGKKTNPFVSPSIGAKFQLIEPLAIHGTAGRAFVTPDAYNVAGFSQNGTGSGKVSIIQGNPDITNENAWTWDAGMSFNQKSTGISADVTYFSTLVKDRITRQVINPKSVELTAQGDTVKSRTTYINANKAEISGLEAVVGYDVGALNEYTYSLRLFASVTSIIKSKEITINPTTQAETAKDISNVAKFNASYGVEYDNLKSIRVRLSARYVGHRKDTDFSDATAPTIDYPAFMIADLVASYTVAKKHTISLFINNLTDENYYEKRGYNMPGRTLSVRYGITF